MQLILPSLRLSLALTREELPPIPSNLMKNDFARCVRREGERMIRNPSICIQRMGGER